MKEKVILPEGAEHQRVEVAEAVSKAEQKAKRKPIPKPEPLIGGTPVYQKDNGTGYWYCKIKDGRDEFMYLYFGDLKERDVLYDANGRKREFVTARQKQFMKNCLKAVRNKPKKVFRWIPVYEPSQADDKGKNIQYVSGKNVLIGENDYDWKEKLEYYSPDNGSQMASITTYFLLAVRWLKDGIATIDNLVDDSSNIGHYRDSKNAKSELEKTGEREFGGLYGFVGNTYKIVKDVGAYSGFSILGGGYREYGYKASFARRCYSELPGFPSKFGIAIVELTK